MKLKTIHWWYLMSAAIGAVVGIFAPSWEFIMGLIMGLLWMLLYVAIIENERLKTRLEEVEVVE